MKSSGQEGTIRGPFEVTLIAIAVLVTGIVRFVLHRHFSWTLALYCLLAVPASIFLLMVFDYTLHHARLVSLLVLAMVVVLAIDSPSFCVGFGIALLGMILAKWP